MGLLACLPACRLAGRPGGSFFCRLCSCWLLLPPWRWWWCCPVRWWCRLGCGMMEDGPGNTTCACEAGDE